MDQLSIATGPIEVAFTATVNQAPILLATRGIRELLIDTVNTTNTTSGESVTLLLKMPATMDVPRVGHLYEFRCLLATTHQGDLGVQVITIKEL